MLFQLISVVMSVFALFCICLTTDRQNFSFSSSINESRMRKNKRKMTVPNKLKIVEPERAYFRKFGDVSFANPEPEDIPAIFEASSGLTAISDLDNSDSNIVAIHETFEGNFKVLFRFFNALELNFSCFTFDEKKSQIVLTSLIHVQMAKVPIPPGYSFSKEDVDGFAEIFASIKKSASETGKWPVDIVLSKSKDRCELNKLDGTSTTVFFFVATRAACVIPLTRETIIPRQDSVFGCLDRFIKKHGFKKIVPVIPTHLKNVSE